MRASSEKDISVAFEKLAITHSDLIFHVSNQRYWRLSIIWEVDHIQTPITTNNLIDTSNFTQKSKLKIEAQLPVLKSYIGCEMSTLTSKIDVLSKSLKHELANLQKRESN